MAKHLVIALGGTGLKMARALRCIIAEELKLKEVTDPQTHRLVKQYCRMQEGKETVFPDFDVRYLEIDSSAPDLSSRFIGRNNQPDEALHLGSRNLLCIQTGGNVGAGCNRATGAGYFNQFAGEFDRRVLELVSELGDGEISIHVCSGTAGGTGAGSVVDVVCRLRQLFPHPAMGGADGGTSVSGVRISLYLQLPLAKPKYQTGGYYWANGYAVLRELSALNTRRWTPIDFNTADRRPYRFDANADTPIHHRVFDTAYLVDVGGGETTTLSSNGTPAAPLKDSVAVMVGQFLYQKIFAIPLLESHGFKEDFFRVDRSENLDRFSNEIALDTPHEILAQVATEPHKLEPYAEHARCFARMGLKRLCVPSEEIKEHFAALLAREGLLQLLYNEGTEGGYISPQEDQLRDLKGGDRATALQEAKDRRVAECKREIDLNKQKYKFIDPILKHERDFDSATQNDCISIEQRWAGIAADMNALGNDAGLKWPQRIEQCKTQMEDIFQECFDDRPNNQSGVDKYYGKHSAPAALKLRAQTHLSAIQDSLLDRFIRNKELTDETVGLQRLLDTCSALLKYINEDLVRYVDERREKQEKLVNDLQPDMERRYDAFLNLGFLSSKLKPFLAYVECSRRYYEARTSVRAWEYAAEYVKALRGTLEAWETELNRLYLSLHQALEGPEAQDASGQNGVESILACTCPKDYDAVQALQSSAVVKIYDSKQISDAEGEYKRPEIRQNFIKLLREKLMDEVKQKAPKNQTNFGVDALCAVFNDNLKDFVMRAAREALEKNEALATALPELNINRQIASRFPRQAELAGTLNRASGFLADTNNSEIILHAEPNPPLAEGAAAPLKTAVFIYPEEGRKAIETLISTMGSHIGADRCLMANYQQNEITILRIESTMPARIFQRVVTDLHQNYRAKNQEQDLPSLHCQPKACEVSDLFFPTRREIAALLRGNETRPGTGDESLLNVEIGNFVTSPVYGNLRQLYLLGHIRPDASGTNWVMDDITKAPVGGIQPLCVLCERHPDEQLFLDRPLRRFVAEKFLKGAPDLGYWFSVMKIILKEWKELFARYAEDPVKQAASRKQARELLDEAWQACVTKYPDVSHPEYKNMQSIYVHFNEMINGLF